MVWWGVSAIVVSPNWDDMGEKATPQESRVGKRKLGSGVTKSLGQKEAMAAGAGLFPPKRGHEAFRDRRGRKRRSGQ